MKDHLERELSDSLHQRVDRMADSPISLADVRGRARGITRRRRLATAAGIAAAAAIVVPTVLLAVPGDDRADIAPAVPSPTTSQVTPEHARAGGEGLDVADLPMGDPPAIGYLDRSAEPTIVRPDGQRIPLDLPGEIHGFATMVDGTYVVVAGGEGGDRVAVVDAAGRWREVFDRSGGVALNQERTQVAYTSPDGTVQVLAASATEPRALGTLPKGSSVASMAGECVWDQASGSTGGCVVTADVPGEDGTTLGWAISSEGANGPFHPQSGGGKPPILSVADFATVGERNTEQYGEMVAGITEVQVDGTCSGVYGTLPGQEVSWSTCDHRFDAFSPDAGRIMAWEAYGDGLGHTQVGMYDVASGKPVWDRVATEQDMAFIHSATWEDDTHLLAMAYQDGAWHLVRFGPDGSMELAAEPVDGDETQPPYVPEIQP
jgi:hypothetical protein